MDASVVHCLVSNLAAASPATSLAALFLVYGLRVRITRCAGGKVTVDVQIGRRKHDG